MTTWLMLVQVGLLVALHLIDSHAKSKSDPGDSRRWYKSVTFWLFLIVSLLSVWIANLNDADAHRTNVATVNTLTKNLNEARETLQHTMADTGSNTVYQMKFQVANNTNEPSEIRMAAANDIAELAKNVHQTEVAKVQTMAAGIVAGVADLEAMNNQRRKMKQAALEEKAAATWRASVAAEIEAKRQRETELENQKARDKRLAAERIVQRQQAVDLFNVAIGSLEKLLITLQVDTGAEFQHDFDKIASTKHSAFFSEGPADGGHIFGQGTNLFRLGTNDGWAFTIRARPNPVCNLEGLNNIPLNYYSRGLPEARGCYLSIVAPGAGTNAPSRFWVGGNNCSTNASVSDGGFNNVYLYLVTGTDIKIATNFAYGDHINAVQSAIKLMVASQLDQWQIKSTHAK